MRPRGLSFSGLGELRDPGFPGAGGVIPGAWGPGIYGKSGMPPAATRPARLVKTGRPVRRRAEVIS